MPSGARIVAFATKNAGTFNELFGPVIRLAEQEADLAVRRSRIRHSLVNTESLDYSLVRPEVDLGEQPRDSTVLPHRSRYKKTVRDCTETHRERALQGTEADAGLAYSQFDALVTRFETFV